MIILELIHSIALLVALAATYQVIGSRFEKKNVGYQILAGLLFGGVGLVGMMTPLHFGPGVIFDGRSIILCLSGLFGGPVVAAVAALVCGSYRVLVGGAGAWVGVGVIVESAALGVIFYLLWKGAVRQLTTFSIYILGLLVHVVMLALMLALPGRSGPEVLRQIGLPILVLYPLATMLVGRIFLDYEIQIQDRKALKEREQFLTAIVENIPDMIFVKAAKEFRFVRINKAAEDLLGYSREEMIGKHDYDIFGKEEADFFRAKDREILETIVMTEIPEETIQTRHKGDRILRTKKIPLCDERGIPQYVLGISEDITERKRAEEELRESEQKFRAIFENDHVVMLIVDPQTGAIEDASPAACNFYGYPQDDLKKKTMFDISTARPDVVMERMRRASIQQCELLNLQHRLANGELRDVEGSSGPVTIGGRTLLFAVFYDVTEQKRIEAELKASELRYRLVVENSTDVIWTMNPNSARFTFMSTSVEQMFGYSPEEALAMPLEAWALPEKLPLGLESLRQLVSGEQSKVVYEAQVRHKNGSIVWCEIVASLWKDEKSGATQIIGVSRDVTERKESERKLQVSEANLRSFFDAIPESLFLLKRDGTIIMANKCSADRYDTSVTSLVGRNIFDVFPPESVDKRRRYIDKVLRTEQPQELFDERFGRYMHTHAYPVFNSDGVLDRLALYAADIHEKKMMEESLRTSEERYRTIVDLSPTGIYVSVDGRIAYVNESLVNILGFSSASDIVGETVFSLFHPDYHEIVRNRIATMLETGRPAPRIEQKYMRANGTLVDVEVAAALIEYEGRRGILVILNDITDRIKAGEALRQSEERFRQVAEVAGEWIWEVDENGLFRYCSSALEQILGYLPQELVGQRYFWEFLEPHPQQESRERALEVFERKELFKRYVTTYVRKDGEILIIEISGVPTLDSDGTFLGYRGTVTDITERERAAESRELLATVIEHGAEAVVVTDTEGNIKYVNPAFERISGYTSEEVIGNNPRILKSGKQDDNFYRQLWTTVTDGRVWRGNFINKKKDGSLFEEEATISPLRDTDGKIMNYVAVKRDVTKEAQLQRQLIQSQKMEAIGTLAGGIAHDFNNIIFAMTGYTELAMDDLPEGSQARSDLERVLGAGKRAGEMVKQILTFSRQGEAERKPLDLSPIVKEGLKFLRASIPSTIEIRQNIKGSLGKVNADPTQIHQVLMNLCTNASHAMRDTKGILTVELSRVTFDSDLGAQRLAVAPGEYIKMTVSDTGHGIPPDIIQRIFEPYFTTKEIHEGTGLGLSVIHGIVKSHGGAIKVYSEPGQGSTFNVFLPVMEVGAEAESPPAGEPLPTGHERVLMVDDEEIMVDMEQRMLERLGYEVVTTTHPTEALELLRTDPQRFDLVITDLTMPKMTGLELAAEIALLRPGMPLILCTGFGHKFTEEEAGEAGIQAVIKKPISKKDMARTVRDVLDRKD